MRIVREEGELEDAFHRAKSEAEKSFPLPFDDDVAPNNHVHISEQYYHIHPQ
jgi:biotin carboxylase